ncbi:MAG: hypothetical protein PUC73_03405 [Lachnospiraceae bacterium]|nr:hypothetical protein [Lachnospiraceae bacterium]
MNIFKKLLRKELGEARYNGLVTFVNKHCGPEVRNNTELYEEIYEYCSRLDSERIVGMQMRLNEVMYSAFQVGRTYSLAFFIYLGAWFVLLSMELQTELLLGGILAITVCFGLKTVQFFTNRCAYADARIIETYRMVLERILVHRARGQND